MSVGVAMPRRGRGLRERGRGHGKKGAWPGQCRAAPAQCGGWRSGAGQSGAEQRGGRSSPCGGAGRPPTCCLRGRDFAMIPYFSDNAVISQGTIAQL